MTAWSRGLRTSPTLSADDPSGSEHVPRAELLRQDLVAIADELRDEVAHASISASTWGAIAHLRQMRFAEH